MGELNPAVRRSGGEPRPARHVPALGVRVGAGHAAERRSAAPAGRRRPDAATARSTAGGYVRRDPTAAGSRGGWPPGASGGPVRTSPTRPTPAVTGAASARSYAGDVAWFRTAFTVGAGGDHALRFESVHHRARVWVDGRQVARHTGAYLPFEARVRLAPAATCLVVRADWRSPDAMKADAWHRSWFNFGGINREVTLRRLGPARSTRRASSRGSTLAARRS